MANKRIVSQIAAPIFSKTASDNLKLLEPIFYQLNSIYQLYTDSEQSEDCPFWYRERAQVGFLSAAVWRSGGTALLEYPIVKTPNQNSIPALEEDRPRSQWCDLYIRINENLSFECEAKQLWFSSWDSPNLEKLDQTINRGLEDAVSQIQRLESGKGLALCFVTLTSADKDTSIPRTHFKTWYGTQKAMPKNGDTLYDALIWISTVQESEPEGRNEETRFFGMLLAVKEI